MRVSHSLGRESRTVAALLALAIAAVTCLTVAAGSASAATSASMGGCTVRPHNPYTFVSNGVRYARASIYVTCSTGRSGLTRAAIMESDLGGDDTVAPMQQQSMFTIQPGQTKQVGTVTGVCRNHDLVGGEELYAKAQVNVGGVWSGVAQTSNVDTTC